MPTFLSPKQAATHLHLSLKTLEKWRSQGTGPPFLKFGKKAVRYRLADLDEWANAQRSSTR